MRGCEVAKPYFRVGCGDAERLIIINDAILEAKRMLRMLHRVDWPSYTAPVLQSKLNVRGGCQASGIQGPEICTEYRGQRAIRGLRFHMSHGWSSGVHELVVNCSSLV